MTASPAPAAWPARLLLALLAAASLLLGGCASLPGEGTHRYDPWESTNRRVFAFNEALDEAAIKPVAQLYQAVLPAWLRTGVSNAFGNLGDIWTSANLLLQAKPKQALDMGFRAGVNSVFGLGGLFDVADEMGLERFTTEDFGQTLGFWGLRAGPYVVLPLLGPSTLRDTAGLLLDFKDSGPGLAFDEPRSRNLATGLQLIDTRVRLLNAGRVLDDIALDKYILLRDAYLARRKSLIYDGDPPDEDTAPAPFKSLIKR